MVSYACSVIKQSVRASCRATTSASSEKSSPRRAYVKQTLAASQRIKSSISCNPDARSNVMTGSRTQALCTHHAVPGLRSTEAPGCNRKQNASSGAARPAGVVNGLSSSDAWPLSRRSTYSAWPFASIRRIAHGALQDSAVVLVDAVSMCQLSNRSPSSGLTSDLSGRPCNARGKAD